MAYTELSGGSWPTLHPMIGCEVFAKWNWLDAWDWLPFCEVTSVSETAAPTVSTATIRYRYGEVARPDRGYADVDDFLRVGGAFISVVVYTPWGWTPIFHGVAEPATFDIFGSTGFPSGIQTVTCYGMEHLLDRTEIRGSLTEVDWIDRLVPFNTSERFGLKHQGNRGDVLNASNVYTFGGTSTWGNTEAAAYLLEMQINAFSSDIQFYLAGALDALNTVQAEFRQMPGMSVKQALDRLIERRRGFGYTVYTDGEGPIVWIYVFTLVDQPIYAGQQTIPANADQNIISVVDNRSVTAQLTVNRAALYDGVQVDGANILTCFTLAYAHGTLEKGWTTEDEAAYLAGAGDGSDAEQNDAERRTDKLEHVFALHKLPAAWNGYVGDLEGTQYLALPRVDYWAQILPDTVAPLWQQDKTFESTIPLARAGSLDTNPEYRPILGIIYNDEDSLYYYLDGLKALEIPNVRTSRSESQLAVRTQGQVSHVLALNHWDGAEDSATEPSLDYENIYVTVAMRTDFGFRVYLPLWPQGGGPLRVKRLFVPDAEFWYIVPDTIIDLADGVPVLQANDDSRIVRDDADRLRQIAVMAAAWYGKSRATLHYTLETFSFANPVGSLILALEGPEGVTYIGTVVTQRSWEFSNGRVRTTVQTAYDELDFTP